MSAKETSRKPPCHILVAEDDANDVWLLKRAFAKAGLTATVSFVTNGQEVIAYLEGNPPFDNRSAYPLPNLLMLDLKMPGIGGLEVLEWLATKPKLAGLRVVVFSSCAAPEDSRYAVKLGALSCMTKPLDPLYLAHLFHDLPSHSASDRPV